MKISDYYECGENMLRMQENLADEYKYKPLSAYLSPVQRDVYKTYLPDVFKTNIDDAKETFAAVFPDLNHPIFSLDGLLLANKADRIVIGDYGAFIEVADKDMIKENLKVKPGQEYRINDERYAKNVKYHWYIPKEGYETKCYYQQRSVSYADYKPGCWYFSPYEVCLEENLIKEEIYPASPAKEKDGGNEEKYIK